MRRFKRGGKQLWFIQYRGSLAIKRVRSLRGISWQAARQRDSRHVQLTCDNVSASDTRFQNILVSA